MDSGCGLTNARGRSQPEHRTQQDAPNVAAHQKTQFFDHAPV
jgi:hypothetical protein